jgi:glycosyltransferase involved in cell wall biosynthesis
VATSPHKTTAQRLAFYGTFAAGAFAVLMAIPRPDVVIATSPPLPGAWAAAAAARARRIPFVLDVRDLWPAAAAALGELSNERLLALFERGERWIYRTAAAVTATTGPFCRHIDAIAGRDISVHLPNGALDALLKLPTAAPETGAFTVGYAGNMGIAQGLGIVLDAAAILRDRGVSDVRFRLVGTGPVERDLRAQAAARRLTNVTFEEPIPVDRIGVFLQSVHALLIPLRAHALLGDFIPSKLYDAMAVGRPAIVAAGREAAELVERTGCGLVIPPESGSALADAIQRLAANPELSEALGAAGRGAAPALVRSRQLDRLTEVLADASHRR